MDKNELKVSVSYAWWWRPYVFGVICMCILTGSRPDMDRVAYWCKRAVRMRYD